MNDIETYVLNTLMYLAGSAMMVLFFGILAFHSHRNYLNKWTKAWGLLTLSNLFLYLSLIANVLFAYLFSYCLIASAFYFFQGTQSFYYKVSKQKDYYFLILMLIIITFASLVNIPFLYRQILVYGTASFYYALAGINFMKAKSSHYDRYLGVIAFLLISVVLIYPFGGTSSWFLPWGPLLNGMLGLAIGLGAAWLHLFRLSEDQIRVKNELLYMSYHDGLTGLFNQLYLEKTLEEMDQIPLYPLSVIMADLNNLKVFNDTYGHDLGDRVLIETSRIFMSHARENDVVCRRGGDEFVMLLPNTQFETAEQIMNSIQQKCHDFQVNGISISIAQGCATKVVFNEDIHQIIRAAEMDMYHQKRCCVE